MRTFVCVFALLLNVAASSSFRSAAAPSPATAAATSGGPEIDYSKEFEKDWHNEWKHGDYPSYKETYQKDVFPGRAAVVAAEDDQSDGKPGEAGLKGEDVGAYLKHHADGTIER
mmetsp:Transcript_100843/g.159466  ORF Transcript_100843/g.159466 Transcript_100843/m.159466 type:complete len:114 (-) Transcript_100843:4-345(-)